MKFWFWLDLVTVLPFNLLEGLMIPADSNDDTGTENIKLVRLMRMPRLYKIIRLLRMSKIMKVAKNKGQFNDWIEKLNISLGTSRLLKVMMVQIFLLHLVSCFWFLAASLEENIFGTWVGHRGVVDEGMGY